MKIVGLLVSVFVVFFASGQNSYYFAEPLPSANMEVDRVSEKYFGSYQLKDGTITFQFDASGLVLISTTLGNISKETVRESSQYQVRNGFIFGIEEGDSVPCYLEDDYYHFGVRNRDIFIGESSKNSLCKTSDPSTYVLNVYESGRYVPQLLQFKGNKLTISHFDYSGEESTEFAYVESRDLQEQNDIQLVILKPKVGDFDRIRGEGFIERMTLKR